MEEAIAAHGGMGLVTFLAETAGIAVISLEPPECQERDILLEFFSREQIQYYYFSRLVRQWQRHSGAKPEFRQFMERALLRDRIESGWQGFDFSLSAMEDLHRSFFKQELDLDDVDFFRSITSSSRKTTWVNRVAYQSNAIRDRHMVVEISRHIHDFCLFGIVGANHVAAQEPELRRAFFL